MRQRIVNAARRLFVTQGYESTTIRGIADAIEYTPGAIYSYFPDKDAIFYALHQQGFLELRRRFVAALSAGGSPGEQLRRVGDAYLVFARENPEMYHLMFLAQTTSRAVDKADEWPEGKAAYEALRALVQLALSTGWIRAEDPDVIAFALWSVAHGALALEICHRQAVLPAERRSELAASAFHYVLNAILVEPEPAASATSATSAQGGAATSAAEAAPRPRRSAKES
jgi:AcrR family transcriptional regulator